MRYRPGGREIASSSGLLRSTDILLGMALACEYALMDVLAPTLPDSTTVGEENEEIDETEMSPLRCIQFKTLAFEAASAVSRVLGTGTAFSSSALDVYGTLPWFGAGRWALRR